MIGIKSSHRLFFLMSSTLGGSLLFSACATPSVQTICIGGWVAHEEKLTVAGEMLFDRSIASILEGEEKDSGQSVAPIPLTTEEQRYWRRWATQRLAATQRLIDHLDDLDSTPGVRTALRTMEAQVNQWVFLYGAADLGNGRAVRKSLKKGMALQSDASEALCKTGF